MDGRGRSTEDMLNRVCGEYLEMPGLCLTRAQAERLWGLDPDFCQTLMDVLVELKFLWRTNAGAYRRLANGTTPRLPLPMAKPHLHAGRIRNGVGVESPVAGGI